MLRSWKGGNAFQGSSVTVCPCLCPSEAFHSANMSIHYGRSDKKSVCLPGPELVLPQGSFCLGNCLSDESSQDPSPPLCCDEFWAEVRFQLGPIIFFLALLCGSCAQLTFQSSFPWRALLSRRAVNEARASCGDHLQGSQSTWLSQCQTVSC